MKLGQFRKEYSGAPYDLTKLAHLVESALADSVTGIGSAQECLVDAAHNFLIAQERFEKELKRCKIEQG